jgi:hypothetical protein
MRNSILAIVIIFLGFGIVKSHLSATQNELETWEELLVTREKLKIEYHQNELERFLDDIGFTESGNRYHITNPLGYMGKYQFGKSTLKGLGYHVSRNEFLNNPELQEEAMLSLLLYNKEKLQRYIDKYSGMIINGVEISESGILAAAHLGGERSVRRYFEKGKIFKDGNGTKITSYLSKFSGYDINLN